MLYNSWSKLTLIPSKSRSKAKQVNMCLPRDGNGEPILDSPREFLYYGTGMWKFFPPWGCKQGKILSRRANGDEDGEAFPHSVLCGDLLNLHMTIFLYNS
jgi:hypothetical protein